MAAYDRFKVTFDNGTSVEVQPSSRDNLKLERDGHQLHKILPGEATYMLVYAAALRHKAKGLIDCDVPDTFEGFVDTADLEPVDAPKEKGQDGSSDS